MKFTGYEADSAVLDELGKRIKQQRIASNITQEEFAAACGISVSTLVRIERGEDTKVSNLIKILRGFGYLSNMELLIPEKQEDLRSLYELQNKPAKQRASKKKTSKQTFVWGEDE